MRAWERVKFVMENEGHNKNSFSKAIGMSSNVTITRLINEERKPHRNTLKKIARRFPSYSEKWLFDGEGGVYKQPDKEEEVEENDIQTKETVSCDEYTVSEKRKKVYYTVPLVGVRAQYGYVARYNSKTFINSLPVLPAMVDREFHGKYRMFEVDGDSMDNDTRRSICDGDIVLGREVQPHLWLDRLNVKDWFFVIVHRTDGVSIKQITGVDLKRSTVTCHSLNEMFDDYTIRLDDVVELYHVIRLVDRNVRL